MDCLIYQWVNEPQLAYNHLAIKKAAISIKNHKESWVSRHIPMFLGETTIFPCFVFFFPSAFAWTAKGHQQRLSLTGLGRPGAVHGFNPSEKYESVSRDDKIPNRWKRKCSKFQTTSQAYLL